MFPVNWWRALLAVMGFVGALGAIGSGSVSLGASQEASRIVMDACLVGALCAWPWLAPRAIRWLMEGKSWPRGADRRLDQSLRAFGKSGVSSPTVVVFAAERPTAMTVGTRHGSLIALSSGALEKLSVSELSGMLAHEIAHLSLGHLIQRYWLLAGLFLAKALFGGFGIEVAVFMLLVGLHLLRSQEYEADKLAAKWIGHRAMADSLRRVCDLWGQELTQSRWAEFISTHPRFDKRLRRLDG